MTGRRSVMLGLAGLLVAGCGDGGGGSAARIPSAAELAGTYDLTVTPDEDTPPIDGVALVSGNLDIELSTPYAGLGGPLEDDGTVALEGMTLGSDAIMLLSGEALAQVRDGVYRISGTITNTGFAGPSTFVMERGVGADVRSESGRCRVTLSRSPQCLDCVSHIDLDLVVTAAGTGTAAGAFELDRGGTPLGQTGDAVVNVAPHGAFFLGAPYGDAGSLLCHGLVGIGPCRLSVRGTLPDRPGTSRDASFVIQDFFTFEVASGGATVVRLDD